MTCHVIYDEGWNLDEKKSLSTKIVVLIAGDQIEHWDEDHDASAYYTFTNYYCFSELEIKVPLETHNPGFESKVCLDKISRYNTVQFNIQLDNITTRFSK